MITHPPLCGFFSEARWLAPNLAFALSRRLASVDEARALAEIGALGIRFGASGGGIGSYLHVPEQKKN